MELQLALAPDLEIDATDFAEAWNSDAKCRDAAEARPVHGAARQLDAGLVSGTLVVLGTIATGVATSLITDLIKGLIAKQGVRKQTELIEIKNPDGSSVLVARIVEEDRA
jgi:hypothetical protein